MSFRRFAAIAAIVSLPLSAACLLLLLIAIDFNMEAFTTYSLLLDQGEQASKPFRWGMLLDMLGYYLLIVPAILWARGHFKAQHKEWLDLAAVSLLGYSLIGAIGAVVLATTIPPILTDIASASETQRIALEASFNSLTRAVYDGLWNLLEQLAGGVGWLILGFVLFATHHKLGLLTIVLGISCLVDAAGSIIHAEAIASVGQSIYLVLAPLWAGWLGVMMLRRQPQGTDARKTDGS